MLRFVGYHPPWSAVLVITACMMLCVPVHASAAVSPAKIDSPTNMMSVAATGHSFHPAVAGEHCDAAPTDTFGPKCVPEMMFVAAATTAVLAAEAAVAFALANGVPGDEVVALAALSAALTNLAAAQAALMRCLGLD